MLQQPKSTVERLNIDRREFLQTGSALAAGLWVAGGVAPVRAEDQKRLRVGVMGLSRGLGHVAALLSHKEQVEIAYLCEVDANRLEGGIKRVVDKGEPAPQGVTDFRKMLDDPKLDAVFIATCNHWHTPATMLCCAAGKHVYVEKPGSHNAAESEMIVASARKHNRVVQMGNQRRTWPAIREAIEKIHGGAIGKVTYARCFVGGLRPSIGNGMPADPPKNLNYELWQGPAPDRPFKTNLIPYNWHWHWHWGGGEMANNGIHCLDVARWGLGVEAPNQVSFIGGRFAYNDDQETPDTAVGAYHFGDKEISIEISSCHPRRGENTPFITFYGDQGIIQIIDPGYRQLDIQGKEVSKNVGEGDRDLAHFANFLECVRTGAKPNSEIEEGQKGSLLCHLANISYRVGRTLRFDPATHKIIGDPDAMKLWGREYRPGWEPKV